MSSQTVSTTIPSTDGGISYTPTDAWIPDAANGATNGQGEFLVGDSEHGLADAFITYTFSQPATGLEYWAWQRSDGGLFSIAFDSPPTFTGGAQIDALNKSTNGSEWPVLLYANYNLNYALHNVTLANLFDSRATIGGATNGGYGQMSLDHFVLISPAQPPASQAPSSTSAPPGNQPQAPAPTTSATDTSSSPDDPSPSPTTPSSASSSSTTPTSSPQDTTSTSARANGLPAPASGSASLLQTAYPATTLGLSPPSFTSSTSSAADSGPNTQSTVQIAPIVGGVVGGLAVLGILVLLLWLLVFRNRPREPRASQDAVNDEAAGSAPPARPAQVQMQQKSRPPYVSNAASGGPTSPKVGSPNSAFSNFASLRGSTQPTTHPILRPLPSISSRSTHRAGPSSSGSDYPLSSSLPASSMQLSSNRHASLGLMGPRRENDAGFLQGDEDEDDGMTLPPDYDAATARRRATGIP